MSDRSAWPWLWLALVMAVPAPSAAWTHNGAIVGPCDSLQHTPVIAPDAGGGAFIVWEDRRGGNNTRTIVQHLTSIGDPAPTWSAAGLMLASDGYRDHPVVIADGAGGVFVADDGTDRQITSTFGRDLVYHLAGDGSAAGGWPAGGIVATGDPGGIGGGVHGDYLPALALDGAGGACLAWTFRDRLTDLIKVIRFVPGGAAAPGWDSRGTYIKPGFTFQTPAAACPDGSGGLLVALQEGSADVIAARFDASGAIVAGWPVRVAPNTLSQAAPGIVPDGSGGAIVAWQDKRNGSFERTYAQHLLGDGSTAPGWPVDGLALSAFATDAGIRRNANYDATLIRYSSIIADAAGGAYVAWTDIRGGPGTGDIYLQRVGGDGSIAGGWPSVGLDLCAAADDQSLPSLGADGAGGVFAAWQDRRSGSDYDVYAQHVAADGSIASGWVANGNPVSVVAGDQITPVVTAQDPARAIVAWTDGRNSPTHVYAGLAGPEGPTATLSSLVSATASPGWVRIVWALGGDPLRSVGVYRRKTDEGWSLMRRVEPDGLGQVVLEDHDVTGGARYGYRMGWLGSGGEVSSPEVWLDVPGAARLALIRTWPNPASERLDVWFSLSTSRPATIGWLDIAGRRIMEREVGSLGPGSHVIAFAGLGRVQPGVFVLRLTQGNQVRIARVCVTR